jgi:F0F1-type ATP synthase membrane subunit b/b'
MEALQEIAGKIGFDWRIALSHTINLGIIFFILVKFALPKLKSIIDERTEKIKQGLKNKEESEQVLAEARLASEQAIKEAQKEKREILDKGEEMAKSNIDKSKSEASEIVSNAKMIESDSEKKGFDSGINLLENKIGGILKSISMQAFDGKVDASIENNFIKKIFEENYAKK